MVPSSKVNVELEGKPLLKKIKKNNGEMWPPEQNPRTPPKLGLKRPRWETFWDKKKLWGV